MANENNKIQADENNNGESLEIPGTPENIAKIGSPISRADESTPIRYYFYPTWRSQLFPLAAFFILSILAIMGSEIFPNSILSGKLFSIGNTTLFLNLPLLALIPGAMLGKILIYIYNSRYIIDSNGVEAQIGLVSLSLRQPRLRYEDIRGVEPNQTILDRILGIGSVLIGSAMTQDVEIVMRGVADPRAIQLLISSEREKRIQMITKAGRHLATLGLSGD
jgi:uncharacterized membrane protein YdbT with pleckstrin-like domain